MSCKASSRSIRYALLATTVAATFFFVFFITFFSINSIRANRTPTPMTLSPTAIAPTKIDPLPTSVASNPRPIAVAPNPWPIAVAPTPSPTAVAPNPWPTAVAPNPWPTAVAPSPVTLTAYGTLSPTIAPTSSQKEYVDKVFLLKSAIDNAYCLDIKGGSIQDLTPLELHECNGSASQRFYFDSDDRLRSKLSPDICVEMDPKYDVFVHSACIDKWEVDDWSQPGNILLRNIGDDMCMASEASFSYGPSVTNGTPIIRGDCGAYNYDAGFQIVTSFSLKSTIDNAYCLDVKSSNTKDLTPLQLYECNGTDAQKFYFGIDDRLRSKLSPDICVEMDPQYDVFVHSACIDKWEVDDWIKPGHIILKNIGDDMCMASESSLSYGSSSVTNGTPIIRGDCGLSNYNAAFKFVW